jgi:hypothetical protein
LPGGAIGGVAPARVPRDKHDKPENRRAEVRPSHHDDF